MNLPEMSYRFPAARLPLFQEDCQTRAKSIVETAQNLEDYLVKNEGDPVHSSQVTLEQLAEAGGRKPEPVPTGFQFPSLTLGSALGGSMAGGPTGLAIRFSCTLKGEFDDSGALVSLQGHESETIGPADHRQKEIKVTTLDDGRKRYEVSRFRMGMSGGVRTTETVIVSEGAGGVLTYDYDHRSLPM